jgi:SAM-dependent methyltransferase
VQKAVTETAQVARRGDPPPGREPFRHRAPPCDPEGQEGCGPLVGLGVGCAHPETVTDGSGVGRYRDPGHGPAPYDGRMHGEQRRAGDDDVDRVLGDRVLLGRSGFATGSDLYERARPDYSSESVAGLTRALGIAAGTRVLDVASGTGKLTRSLAAAGAHCVAVEPSAAMRASFASVLPDVVQVGADAERLPIGDATFDAVTVAQAFHWFDPANALAEFARVLRPGGGLALIWNERDESDPMVAELTRISKWDVHQPYPVGKDFGQVVDRVGGFGPVTRTRYRFTQSLDRTAFVEQVASRSYIAVLPEDRRRAILDGVAALAVTLEEPIGLPYLVNLFCTRVA